VRADDARAIATSFILQCTGVVRVFDIVIAMTQGGPGVSTQMPAIYVIQHITDRVNVGQGMAAATMMLLPVVIAHRPAVLPAVAGQSQGGRA
jgi:glucose/mannose transport system permease protein